MPAPHNDLIGRISSWTGSRMHPLLQRLKEPRSRKVFQISVLSLGALLVIGTIAMLSGSWGQGNHSLILYEVRRGDLPITVTARGNLESQQNVKILCEVDDIDGDNIRGTPILWVIPNGASVKKGDLVVELDSASHLERLDRQILETERERAEQIQSRVSYENIKTQNTTSMAEAKLKVELANLALKQFEDEEGGTFQISLQDVELNIQTAEAAQLIEQTNLEGIEQLHKLGYRSRGELAQARLSSLQTKRQLATAVARRRELVAYEYKKQRMQLEGAVASAERSLEQVERDNEARLEQAKAEMEAKDERLKKEEERLARYRAQVDKCKIYAPEDGMVAYATGDRWHGEEIREGSLVRPRQHMLSLPSLSKMQVKTAVHESVVDRIESGLKATIRADAFPDRAYGGSVSSVAVLPDPEGWLSSDTKVYQTFVTIDEQVEQLKPGMTAVVEIHVDRLNNVLSIPIQAIVQDANDTWCYVSRGGSVDRQSLEVGRTNDKFVEIQDGLMEGDPVVLNPMAIVDETKSAEPQLEPENVPAEPSEASPLESNREPTATDDRAS